MLEVAGVSKQYPTPRGPLTVLSEITVSLAPGQAAAITGPSGSGKSSLLYMLGALEPPTAGTVTLDGTNPFTLGASALADFRNPEIGFVFQDHCLLPQCSLLENVLVPTFVARQNGQATGDEPRARALIDQVGLADRLDHRPAALSGGETAARGDRPRAHPSAAAPAVRRADRQSRSAHGGHGGIHAARPAPAPAEHPDRGDAQRGAGAEFPIRFELADQRLGGSRDSR